MTVENPLWLFACNFYRKPGIAAALLALQDSAGLNVNLMLTAIWLGRQQLAWSPEQLQQLLATLTPTDAVLLPLRQARRALKKLDDASLYAQAQQLELAIEQQQIAGLYTLCQQLSWKNADSACSHANMEAYFAGFADITHHPLLQNLLNLIEQAESHG